MTHSPVSSPTPPVSRWVLQPLQDFTPLDLHRLHRARQAVFVVEQACFYQDADDTDERCWHLVAYDAQDQVLACARLVPPGLKYPDASIGRVLTTEAARGTGLGRELVSRAIQGVKTLWPGHAITISAQSRLLRLYEGLGFEVQGPMYMEDWIPHSPMRRAADAPLPASRAQTGP